MCCILTRVDPSFWNEITHWQRYNVIASHKRGNQFAMSITTLFWDTTTYRGIDESHDGPVRFKVHISGDPTSCLVAPVL